MYLMFWKIALAVPEYHSLVSLFSYGGSTVTPGNGIDITNDVVSVKAGENLSFDENGNLKATDTTYDVFTPAGEGASAEVERSGPCAFPRQRGALQTCLQQYAASLSHQRESGGSGVECRTAVP